MAKTKNDIAKNIAELVKKSEKKFKSANSLKLENANEFYNKLISKGIVEKRGFTLRGIEDTHLLHIRPNA